ENLKLRRTRLGDDHRDTSNTMNNLGFLYEQLGHYDKAEPLWREMAALAKKQYGADSPRYFGRLTHLGWNLVEQKKYAEAETCLRDCLAGLEKRWPNL